MITDDELDDLSDDDEVAFVQYETIIRASMERSRDNTWSAERPYTTHMIAFLEARAINFTYTKPPGADNDFADWFIAFLEAIEAKKMSLRLQRAARKKRHVTVLTLSVDFKNANRRSPNCNSQDCI